MTMNVRTDMKSGAACYTVQRNDSLSTIAQRFYGTGDATNVNKIYYSNLSTIGANPNYIYPNQKLYIPD
jgi:nucleoid-associated protein YgaU